ncbi:MAG TPA: GNAT family N-acetyltransferase [Gemmataceae bacterium]|nr:GNAT family N-acetyltransferase [Gemmataceae bacterium]
MPWTIRQAGPADAPIIVEYNRRLAAETESKTLDPAVTAAGVAAALDDPDGKGPYFLAVEQGAVIGQLQITYEWSDWRNGWFWWIQGVYIRAEDRRRGVFRSLYRHVVDLARKTGVVGIRLYVERENHAAQRTYTDLGMKETSYLLLELWPV